MCFDDLLMDDELDPNEPCDKCGWEKRDCICIDNYDDFEQFDDEDDDL